MNNKKAMTGGGIALFAMICVMAVSMRWLDIPIARYFLHSSAVVTNLAVPLGTVELVAGNAILVGAVSLILIIRGSLPEHAKALLLACVASLVAFVFNFVLKVLFGRFTPDQFFLAPGSPIFHFFQGNENSSFPSGHMMMATAFSTVIVRLYAHT
jgi:membrane-associated phospholipid phosphatase